VVFADDDENDYVLLNCALEQAAFPVQLLWVRDGLELLEFLHRQGRFRDTANYPAPRLVLLDLNMPRKNGREALQEIRQDPQLRALPVVVLTTSKSPDDVQLTYQAGANSYITKPADFKNLVEIVRVLKRYWFELVALPAGS
jgi:CheY-like chemotaxis protein